MAVYLIHFEQPYKHARHYIGWTPDDRLETRMHEHRAGQGARLLRVIQDAGINQLAACQDLAEEGPTF